MRSVSPGLTRSCRWYMICDKAVMSRLQVAPAPPPPPTRPLHLSGGREKKWQRCEQLTENFYLSPSVWSPARWSWTPAIATFMAFKKEKKKGGGWDGVGWEWEGAGRGIQTGEGWRLQKEDGKETGGSEYGFSIPAASFFFFFPEQWSSGSLFSWDTSHCCMRGTYSWFRNKQQTPFV